MIYTIIGKGGQGILFLARTLAEALLLSETDNFTFLKEFDEGQRNGEIKVTFFIPITEQDKTLIVTENNILELKKISKELQIEEQYIEEALRIVKPNSFEKNWKVFKK